MYKAILVDDEPGILEGLSDLIDWSELGIEIVGSFEDGAEALSYLQQHDAHILVTDIKMQEISGLELIRKLKEQGKKLKTIVLSGYDDFRYVKEAAVMGIENYLLKPVSVLELKSTLAAAVEKIDFEVYHQMEYRQSLHVLRDNMLHRWMSGDVSRSELQERMDVLQIPLGNGNCRAAILHIMSDTSQVRIPQVALLHFAVVNICNEIAGGRFPAPAYCVPGGDPVIVFIPRNREDDEAIPELLAKCMDAIIGYLGADVFVTVGTLETIVENAHLSFRAAQALQDYRLLLPPNRIIRHEDQPVPSADGEQAIDFDALAFQQAVFEIDVHAVELLDETAERLVADGLSRPGIIREWAVEVVLHLKYAIRRHMRSPYSVLASFDVISMISSRPTVGRLKHWLKQLTEHVLNELRCGIASDSENPVIRQLCSYLQQHYLDDLNLTVVADRFRINPSYLGRLFKKETGLAFTDYLNRIRIEAAKRYLVGNERIKVSDIGEKVGYTNANYFFITFKKYENVSPVEYRRSRTRT